MYNREYTPEYITELQENEIFVFGSNLEGAHYGGAARVARERFGAIMGQGDGLQGQSYAIPTMHGGVDVIRPYVDEFIAYAKMRPDLKFYVTRIGCGIAGFSEEDIAPLFIDAMDVENIILPWEFVQFNNMIQATQIIGLTKENYTEFLPLCPIAFSMAEGGAMGSPGEVLIVDKKLNTYNFFVHCLETDIAKRIIPTLFECYWGDCFKETIPAPGWNYVDLGAGNHLMVADSIYREFSVIANGRGLSYGRLYSKWISIVKEILIRSHN